MKHLKENEDKLVYSLLSAGRYDRTGLLVRTKNFMDSYPNDELSKNLRLWIFENIRYAFTNPYLDRALEIPEEYKYTRKAETYKYLPFMCNNTIFRYQFNTLFQGKNKCGNPKRFYKKCKAFCDKYFKDQIPDYYFQRVFDALDKYQINIFASKENGLTFEEEDGIITGKCGEYCVAEWLRNSYPGRTTYVSKECSFDFGFDVLYDDPHYDKEVLIEVKSTRNSFEKDWVICLTPHENYVLEDTTNLKKTEYVIMRVFIDKKTGEKTYLILYYDKDKKLFYNDNNPNYRIEYRNTNNNNPNAKRINYTKVLTKKTK